MVGTQKGWFVGAVILVAGLYAAPALVTVVPVLTNATRSGDQFQFTLLGETNVSYILESSTNLRTWSLSVTNLDSQATRTITVPAANTQTFWRVRPVPSPLFEYAILARGVVLLSATAATGGRIDSFNSTNALESTSGLYDPAKATDRASVVTTSRLPGNFLVGGASVYGSVGTGPGGTINIGNNGNVGTTAFNDDPAYNGQIQAGHSRDDMNVYIPDGRIPMPYGPVWPMMPGLIGLTNYTPLLQSRDYQVSSMSLSSGKMGVSGNARLYVAGTFRLQGSAIIYIAPGASLELYVGGDVDLGGGGVWNYPGQAKNFSVIGFNTCSNVSYAGSAPFCGTIYAPYAHVKLTGNSSAFGAFVGKTFSITETMDLHLDESLTTDGPFR